MKKELSDYLDELYSSDDEDSVVYTLTKIVKNFNVSTYKDIIMSNPYFKSLVLDIRGSIIIEMNNMISLIKEEIDNLNRELSFTSNENDFSQFKELKRECVFLLSELENRKTDLYLLK